MYQTWIPIYNREWNEHNKEKLLSELKRANPELILLTFGRILRDHAMLRRETEIFCDNYHFLTQNGFEVGGWLVPTIGYGVPFYGDNDAVHEYTHVKRLGSGKALMASYCPLDERFTAELLGAVATLSRTGVKTILLEDDFALGCGKYKRRDAVCACERHMKLFADRLGKNLTLEEVKGFVIDGRRNRYREIWAELMGDTMRELASKIEQTVHAFDPAIRIGVSANHATYTDEGTTTPELARILAGKTRPLVRMTGAPYWKQTPTLAPNVEAERMQSVWCGADVECFTEGDTYPRPRHCVPAAYLEAFDMILRADGNSEGILKYMVDYNSSATYETGYIDRHVANAAHYKEIDRRFSGKHCVGLNVFENMSLFVDRVYDAELPIERVGNQLYMPTTSQWFTSDNSIPTVYGAQHCPSLVFGENAQYLTKEHLKHGVILDARAAKLLMERGIDIGVDSIEPGGIPLGEAFAAYGEITHVDVPRESFFYCMELKSGAVTDSEFILGSEGLGVIQGQGLGSCQRYPACYRYQNACGEKFVVYAFVAELTTAPNLGTPGIFRNYCRQKQLADAYRWLAGRPLPAMCYGNPDLYILCKKDENSMSVGVWNLFADAVLHPVIELDAEYSTVDFYQCTGELRVNKILLDQEIPAFGFVFFTVKK